MQWKKESCGKVQVHPTRHTPPRPSALDSHPFPFISTPRPAHSPPNTYPHSSASLLTSSSGESSGCGFPGDGRVGEASGDSAGEAGMCWKRRRLRGSSWARTEWQRGRLPWKKALILSMEPKLRRSLCVQDRHWLMFRVCTNALMSLQIFQRFLEFSELNLWELQKKKAARAQSSFWFQVRPILIASRPSSPPHCPPSTGSSSSSLRGVWGCTAGCCISSQFMPIIINDCNQLKIVILILTCRRLSQLAVPPQKPERSASTPLAWRFSLLEAHQDLLPRRYALEFSPTLVVSVDAAHQQLEPFPHVAPRPRADLHEADAVLEGEGDALVGGDLPLVLEVALGGDEDLADVGRGVVIDLYHPALNILKRSFISDGIGEDDAGSALVVGLRDVLEPLLPRRVPDLQFVLAVPHAHGLDLEVHPDGRHVAVLEVVLAEAGDQVGLPHPAVPDYYHLRHEVVLPTPLRLLHPPLALFIITSPTSPIKFMDEQLHSKESLDLKELFSRVTNINPEEDEKTSGFATFSTPENYELNQSLFGLKELMGQPGFTVVRGGKGLYFGGTYKGLKHGLGVLLTEDTVYEGEFSLDFKAGKGYQKFPNGSIYFGDFVNNKTHGEGSLKFGEEYYVGDFENGCMQGDGLWKNNLGDKYIGEWKGNKAHGYGVYITNVSHYQGNFVKFVKHGQGVQHFKNGDRYKGMYENGNPHGYGQYYWKDGSYYCGDFVKGLREGSGKWVSDIGDQYEGDFRNDKKNGEGVFTWSNGNVYKGQFHKDMREGEGEMIWKDGSNYKGEWKGGLPNGLGTFKINGEKPKTGYYQNNVLVKQIKRQEQRRSKVVSRDDSLILAVIPQLTKKRNFISKTRTFKSRDMKSKITNDTSFGWQSRR